MKKNGVFLFVISHLVPEIFKIFVLCKLGTDDVIRCVKAGVHARAVFTSLNTAFCRYLGHVSSDTKSLCLFH